MYIIVNCVVKVCSNYVHLYQRFQSVLSSAIQRYILDTRINKFISIMSVKKRVRKSKADLLLEGLGINEECEIVGSFRHWQNRQGLFHQKYPKRHVALCRKTNKATRVD